jgi:hypothetical protein
MSSEQVFPSFIAAEQYTVVVISHVWQQQTAAIPDCDLGDLRESLQQQGSVCAAVTKSSTGAAAICSRGGVKSSQW